MDEGVVEKVLAVPQSPMSERLVPITSDRTRYSKRGRGNGAESAL
jgi:hypothetical protein